jgi:hypothetical protein
MLRRSARSSWGKQNESLTDPAAIWIEIKTQKSIPAFFFFFFFSHENTYFFFFIAFLLSQYSCSIKSHNINSIYHKDQQVYTEKETLSLVAKAGVNANSIPDILQGLIDDALVEKMKIGGSNYFWSFKAKKDRMAQIQNDKTMKLIEELKPQVAEAEARLSDAKRGREEDDDDDDEEEKDPNLKDGGNEEKKDDESSGDTANTSTTTAAATSTKKRVGDAGSGGRAKKLARLSELGKQKIGLEKELDKLKENDPAALADLEKELQLVIQSANRWTDNIFECKSYLVKKRGMEKKEANKFLQIPADFDCTYYSFPFFLCAVFRYYYYHYFVL